MVRLVRYGLGTVLAKVETRPSAVWVRPGAAWAIETVLLVQLQEWQRAADQPGLAPHVVKAGDDGLESGGFPLWLALVQPDQQLRGSGMHIAVCAVSTSLRLLSRDAIVADLQRRRMQRTHVGSWGRVRGVVLHVVDRGGLASDGTCLV